MHVARMAAAGGGRPAQRQGALAGLAGVVAGALLGFFTLAGMAATAGVLALSLSGVLTW